MIFQATSAFIITFGLIIPSGVADREEGPRVEAIEYLGQAYVSGNVKDEGTRVGGLSGLVYDGERSVYLAISDDKEAPGPRVYRLKIGLEGGRLGSGGVELEGHLVLTRADGSSVPEGAVDAEGIALGLNGDLFISSEGMPGAKPPVPPSVDRFDKETGRHRGALAVPAAYLPDSGRGVRSNLGFESLTVTPGGRFVDAATENALVQDGPSPIADRGSPCRIVRFDADSGQPVAEYVYMTEPTGDGPAARVAGLVELLAIDEGRWLALERAWAGGLAFTVRLFAVSVDGATDVLGRDSIEGQGVVPVSKRLLLDLGTIDGFSPTNLEGMAFGPDLEDGRRLLILVADNNLISLLPTQFVAFGVRMSE